MLGTSEFLHIEDWARHHRCEVAVAKRFVLPLAFVRCHVITRLPNEHPGPIVTGVFENRTAVERQTEELKRVYQQSALNPADYVLTGHHSLPAVTLFENRDRVAKVTVPPLAEVHSWSQQIDAFRRLVR